MSMFGKIFGGILIIRTLPTILLEIVCKIIINSRVNAKSIVDPGEKKFQRNSKFQMLIVLN